MNDVSGSPILWIHGDCLRPDNPALAAYPGAPAVFVFDDALIERYRISLKRIVFLYECLLELPVAIRRGDVVSEILAFAREHGATRVVTTDSPSPRFMELCQHLRRDVALEVLSEQPFLDYDGDLDLKRFSRYWRVAQRYAFTTSKRG